MQEEIQTAGRRRPVGITVISIILIVFGVLALLLTVLGIIALSGHNSTLSTVGIVALVFAAILSIAEIILGWGLWTLKRWAFWATVIIEAIRVLDSLYSWLVAHNSIGTALFSLIIPVIILIYLFADRNVRAAFRV